MVDSKQQLRQSIEHRGQNRRRGGRLVNVMLIVLGTVLPIVMLEAGMRLYRTYVKVRSIYEPVANERRVFGRKPHSDREINSWGMRDHEYAVRKPDGVYRVLVLGDSVTDGYGVAFNDRYTKKLEARLNQESGHANEVIVLAMNQYSTVQEVELLKDVGLGLDPDLVILAYVLNDPTADGSINDFFRRERLFSLALHWIWTTSGLKAAYRPQAADDLQGCEWFDYYSEMHCDADKWAAVRGALAQLRDLSRRYAFPVLVVVFPVLEGRPDASFADYPWRAIHARVVEEATRNGFLALDLLPHFAALKPADLIRAPGDQLHPNALGNQVAATAIYDAVADLRREGR